MVVPGEMAPTARGVDDDVEATEMTGVEHLGQYVYEMTQAKLKQLEAGQLRLLPQEESSMVIREVANTGVEEEDEPGQPEELDV